MNSNCVLDDVPDIVAAIQHMHTNLRHTEDLTFISSDGRQEFSCHSLIAAIFSPILHDKIYGPDFCRSIKVEDVENIAIENMIRFFYEDDVIFESVSDITETKKLADVYEIVELSKISIKRLANINVNLSNVISVLKTSLEFNNLAKESECLSLISENKETLFTRQSFISLEFENVLDIFDKLRDRNCLTESEFLLSGIRWLETNGALNQRDLLMNKIDISKIPLNDYLNILVSSPEFFSGTEISYSINLIRSREQICSEIDSHKVAETNTEAICFKCKNATTNTEKAMGCIYKNASTNTEKAIGSVYKDAETNTEEKTNHENEKHSNYIDKPLYPQKLKQLTIQILDQPERVQIEATDDSCTRSIVFLMCENLKKGLIGSLKKHIVYTFKDVEINYEGIFYMYRVLQFPNEVQSPLQYLDILKAATFFQLDDLLFRFVGKVGDIISWDPIFINALSSFEYFQTKHIDLLRSKTMGILMHPNFVKCSAYLICLLLEQDELTVESELQLLLAIIMWLEARNRQRWHFRSIFLSKIVFENISVTDIQQVFVASPNFFDDKEKKSILDFKTAEGKENIEICRKNLPDWYNFGSRQLNFYGSFIS